MEFFFPALEHNGGFVTTGRGRGSGAGEPHSPIRSTARGNKSAALCGKFWI
jgi:hypothetical protein